MKKITSLFLILIIVLVFSFEKVKAGEHYLTADYYTLQCIYSDGSLITRNKNRTMKTYHNNRLSYNLLGISEEESANTGKNDIIGPVNYGFEADGGTPGIRAWQCLDYMAKAAIDTTDSDLIVQSTLYKFGTSTFVEFTQNEIKNSVAMEKLRNSDLSDDLQTAIYAALTPKINEIIKRYQLVSESYLLTSDAPDPIVSLYYVQEATQASGNNKYVEVMVYENVVLLRSEKTVTRLEGAFDKFKNITRDDDMKIIGNPPNSIMINDPEAKTADGTGGRISYYYNPYQVRYEMETYRSGPTCRACNQEYVLTDEIIDLDGGRSNELCTIIMPETAVQLKKIIGWSQILVPILLILLTAIDIGKIVLSGNLDEELPKQKTKIFRRLIVAIVFFFLPLIVNLFLELTIDSSDAGSASKTIQLIECLFE